MTPVRDPGLDHLLEEVAAEVLRQDAAGGMSYTRDGEWLANRTYSVQRAAHAIRSMRAIDMAIEPTGMPCTARHDVHEDGVTATWSCQQLGAHGTHKDSQGRGWEA